MTLYPLALRLDGRRVLVVGGGSVATRRVPALLHAGAHVTIVSPTLTPALRAYLDAGRLRWESRRFIPADLDGAWLVHVAVDDRLAAAQVSAAALERRVFCVRADDRHEATAWTPAVTRHGSVTVAVIAGGEPRRAVAVRDAIRTGLESGAFAGDYTPSGAGAGGAGAREASSGGTVSGGTGAGRGPDAVALGDSATSGPPAGADALAGAAVTLPVDQVGDPAGGPVGDPTKDRGKNEVAKNEVKDQPGVPGGAPAARQAVGQVVLVGAGPGDPELITVKGRRMIARADVVVADRLIPGLLLDELRPDAELIDASKIPYGPQKAQEEINRIIVERALAGRFVVRLKGGDPYVFGRGGEELIACAEAGVPVTVVPGVTSSIAAPAAAGIPVTHRGVAHEFTVVSGHLPPDHSSSLVDWAALARMRGTLVVLMGLKNLAAITQTLIAHGRSADTPAAVVQEGTMSDERSLRSTLGAVADAVVAEGLRPPAVLVVGEVVNATTTPVRAV